jgi:hypothetical protein
MNSFRAPSWQGCSLRAKGNQNIEIAEAISSSGAGGRSTRDPGTGLENDLLQGFYCKRQ